MPVLSELSPDTSLLTPDFDGYKLSLDKVPIFQHDFSTGVCHREPATDQFSFLFVRSFGLHNHLHGDPWQKGHVYFFNQDGELVKNAWDSDRRCFESSTVVTLDASSSNGDLNPSLALECPGYAACMDGRSEGTVKVFSTGDRKDVTNFETWKEVAEVKVGVAGTIKGLAVDAEHNEFQLLVESIVHADAISELEYDKDASSSESATLIHWLTINSTLGKSKESIVSERKICVHGAVEYLALEDGGQAVYIGSQKEAIFTFDSDRPCTPPIERALREPINYTWDQTENEIVITFNLHAAIDKKSVEAIFDEEHQKLQVTIKGPEHTKKVIDGTLAHAVNSEVVISAEQGRAEIRLTKKEPKLSWEEFISDDPHGARAPHAEDIKKAAENLEKFTSDQIPDEENFNTGFNPGQLEECDSEEVSSRLVRLPLLSHSASHTVLLSGHQWIGGCRPPPPGPPALLLRHDVDALVWQPKSPEGDSAWTPAHLSTFPGFGYVQASKTSRKWVVAPAGLGWVAVVEGQQHIYLYHQPQPLQTQLTNRKSGQKVKTVARQQVISLPDNAARVLGAYAEDNKLYILHKNALIVLSMAQD